MNNIPINTSVASCVVLSDFGGETKMLLMYRSEDHFWCHIAGKIEGDETAWQTVIREISEEIGITVSSLYTAEFIDKFYEASRNCITLVPVFVAFIPNDSEIVLNEEHSEYRWVSLVEAKAMTPYPNQHTLYDHIFAYFVQRQPGEFLKIKIS